MVAANNSSNNSIYLLSAVSVINILRAHTLKQSNDLRDVFGNSISLTVRVETLVNKFQSVSTNGSQLLARIRREKKKQEGEKRPRSGKDIKM